MAKILNNPNTCLRSIKKLLFISLVQAYCGQYVVDPFYSFSKLKKGTSLFVAKSSGARAPSAPSVPTSVNMMEHCLLDAKKYVCSSARNHIDNSYI